MIIFFSEKRYLYHSVYSSSVITRLKNTALFCLLRDCLKYMKDFQKIQGMIETLSLSLSQNLIMLYMFE